MDRSGKVGAVVSALTIAALLGTAGSGSAAPAGPEDAPATHASPSTPDAEARRVDRVPTPEPEWFDCTLAFGPGNECTTVELPVDYDRPRGRTTSVALLRHPAADQSTKLGTLFLNPGGPGGSGVLFAAAAPFFLGPEVLARFDVVGFDPRGINFSDNVRCWEHMGAQVADLRGLLERPFPVTDAEETSWIASSRAIGRACASFGDPLVGSMSTAQVARDMDVLRRMVGDEQLTYLGFSYGSVLGTVYANLFPGRVRAVAIDGVLDPREWTGTSEDAAMPVTRRVDSGEGAWAALRETLERCEEAGPEYCRLAGIGDPTRVASDLFQRLREEPVEVRDPATGELFFTLTYAILVAVLLGDLYMPEGPQIVDADLAFVHALIEEQAAPGSVDVATVAAARTALAPKARAVPEQRDVAPGQLGVSGGGFPYDNFFESYLSVLCTDGRNPADAEAWRQHADDAAFTAPRFGRLWTWQSAPCADETWTVRDEDAYTGPFDRPTANPLLVVGNLWDPATNYENAVSTAALLPGSALLTSDSWGHTAYRSSACVTGAVDAYLLSLARPAPGTRCEGDVQPFTVPLDQPPAPPEEQRLAAEPSPVPPVVPPVPGGVPRG